MIYFWFVVLICGIFSLFYCAYLLDKDYPHLSQLKCACIVGIMCIIAGFIGASIVELIVLYGF